MKNIMKWQLIALIGVFVISSCATSNDVVSGRLISKRKYNKGFHFNFNKSYKASEAVKQQEETVLFVPNESTIEYNVVEENTNATSSTIEESNTQQTLQEADAVIDVQQKRKNIENTKIEDTEGTIHQNKTSQKIIKFVEKLNEKKSSTKGSDSDVKLILLVILAFIISPLAMYLADGQTDLWFILDLIFYLFWISWIFAPNLGFVGLASIVIALLRVFGVI